MDDTLLLIAPDVARQVAAAPVAPPVTPPGSVISPGLPLHPGTPPAVVREPPSLLPQPGGEPSRAHTFIGTVDVNAATAKMRLVQIADEIISLLTSDVQAAVTVSVEIHAEFPQDVSDTLKRAVSENAASLGFKNKTWE